MKLRSILLPLLLVSSTLHAATLRHHAADPRSGCTLSINPRVLSFPAAGGSAAVLVGTSGHCSWASHASDAWIAASDGAQGVTVTVTPSTSPVARSGSIDVGGFSVTVTQDAFSLPNLVQNGTFDRDLSGWSALYVTGTGSAVWSSNDADGASTSGSALVTSTQASLPNAAAGYQIVQCVAVKPSTRYESGGKVLLPAGQDANGVVTIGVFEYAVPNCDVTAGYMTAHQQYLHSAPAWTPFSDTYVTLNSTVSLLYVLGCGGAKTPPYRTYFDDVYIREK